MEHGYHNTGPNGAMAEAPSHLFSTSALAVYRVQRIIVVEGQCDEDD